jgi:hypothetical protein
MYELKKAIEELLDSEQSARDYPPPCVRVSREAYIRLREIYLAVRDKL